jgi:hypothetical protein
MSQHLKEGLKEIPYILKLKLNVILLNAIMLYVTAPKEWLKRFLPYIFKLKLNVILLNVIILNVAAPKKGLKEIFYILKLKVNVIMLKAIMLKVVPPKKKREKNVPYIYARLLPEERYRPSDLWPML